MLWLLAEVGGVGHVRPRPRITEQTGLIRINDSSFSCSFCRWFGPPVIFLRENLHRVFCFLFFIKFSRDGALFGTSEVEMRRFVLVGRELHGSPLPRLTERGSDTGGLVGQGSQVGDEVFLRRGAPSFLGHSFDICRHFHVVFHHVRKELWKFIHFLEYLL